MTDDRPEYCPRCGHETPTHGRFCAECGADLTAFVEGGPTSGQEEDSPPMDGQNRRDSVSEAEDGGWSRRKLLVGGVAAVGGLAIGLVGVDVLSKPQHRIYSEGWDVSRSQSNGSVQLDGSLTIPAGRYAARHLKPNTTVQYEIDFQVTSGGPIDVLTLDSDEYDRYRDRDQDTQHYEKLSAVSSEGSRLAGRLSADEYMLVFDNSGVFGATPDGEAVIDLNISGSVE